MSLTIVNDLLYKEESTHFLDQDPGFSLNQNSVTWNRQTQRIGVGKSIIYGHLFPIVQYVGKFKDWLKRRLAEENLQD